MPLERLFQQMREDGVPSTLVIDLYDTPGMERALAAELAEVEATRTLDETVVAPEAEHEARTA